MNRVIESMNGKTRSRGRKMMALVALALVLSPYIFFAGAAMAQTEPPQPGEGLPIGDTGAQLSPGAQRTQETVPDAPYADADAEVPLVQEIAEQNKEGVIQNVEDLLRGELGSYNETYLGLHQWFSDDWVSNLFANIGQLIGKWISELIEGWVADTVQFLTAFLRVFVLNPNIAVNGQSSTWGGDGTQQDDISPYIRQGADIMYGIAVDLLLLLFILCIWKYWADAAWRGSGNVMSSVGRLIFTAGLMLAWPTIYAFEIQITNEMIKAIYFNSADQVAHLDAAMAAAVKAGLVATAAGLAHVFAPVIGAAAGGAIGAEVGGLVLGTVGEIVSFAGLIIFLILGGMLIAELVYLLVLKAIQTALLTAQYMFAPVFLVFFATPDTESICSGFVRSFVEVSLWTFIWVGLLKILVIVIYADFNPWGKILMAVGILQIMIQVPSFLSRAQISPMSDFISAGLLTGFILKGATALTGHLGKGVDRLVKGLTDYPYALGSPQSQATTMSGLPTQAANPELLNDMRAAATGSPLAGRPDTGVGAPPQRAAGADPALTVPGATRPETEEQRRAREQQEQLQRAMQAQQANLAGQQQQTAGLTPPSSAVPGLNIPGAMNMPQGTAQIGLNGALQRALSQAGLQRGVADLTTQNVPAGVQAMGAAAAGADMGMLGPAAAGAELNADDGFVGSAMKKPMESGVMNPAERFNHAGYKFVQAKIAAVDARTYNGNSIGYSTDGANKLVGDGKGNLRHMRARKGASPEEVAHLVLAGGFTELFKEDPEALDAARQAALDAGEDGPKGMGERMAAGIIGWQGGTFRQTALAKQRFARALFQHAALGSESYVSGKQGNAYTQYLRTRFGDWTAKDDTWGVHIMTDAASPESPWNPTYVPGTESLFTVGLPITEDNRAAAQNPYVMKLPTWQRKNAIPAVARYVTEIAKSQYANADPMVLAAAVGRIAPQVSNEEVDAALAIQVESHGADVNVGNIQSVARIVHSGAITDSSNAYHALRTVSSVVGGYAVRRRGTMNVDVVAAAGGSSSGSAPPNFRPENYVPNNMGQGGEQQWDVVFNPVSGGSNQGGTVHHTTIQMPSGGGPVAGNPDVRIVGSGSGGSGGGSSGHTQYVEVTPSGSGSAPPPPAISRQDISGHFDPNPLGDPNRVAMAETIIMDMHSAGFKEEHMQDAQIVRVACEVAQQNPQALPTAAVAARILGGQEMSTAAVHTIQTMMDAGWNPNQIQRPDIWTAQAILMNNGGYPTPAEVRKVRLNPRFIPRPGARVPPEIVPDEPGPGNPGSGNPGMGVV